MMIKLHRRLPKPETKEERLENIYNATQTPIHIPGNTVPINLNNNIGIQLIEQNPLPNVFFRNGGLERPLVDENMEEDNWN